MSEIADSLLDAIRETVSVYPLTAPDRNVLVSVSGGSDSVGLLLLLIELGCAVEVAHFDHQTREGASTSDAEYVRALCARLGVAFHAETAPTLEQASRSPMSFEEFAREQRYAFLVDTAKRRGCDVIATGHTADDQAETVLMRVLRGTTPRGLGGIPLHTERGGISIVRPLLNVSRESIRAYLEERGQAFRVDATNEDFRYLRNRIRHETLPRLASEFNPNLPAALCRLAESQRAENELLVQLTESFFETLLVNETEVDRARLRTGHVALQRRALLQLAWQHGVDPDFDRIAGAADFVANGKTGKRFDLGGGVQLCNGRRVTAIVGPEAAGGGIGRIRLAIPGATDAFGTRFRATLLDGAPATPLAEYCTPTRQLFDADALTAEPALRHRRDGDRFVPFGMRGSKKLKDYFNDIGMPPPQRDHQVLLVADDTILWVVGHAIDARAAVTSKTKRVLQIDVRDEV